jgi:RNA polymerase sigma-70 factor (ECF subfamily)
MGSSPESKTGSRTRAFFQNPTADGWAPFVDHYGPKIFSWCRSRGLQPADANDVLQNVLLRLHTSMKKSPWDPKRGLLRSWLKRVTQNAVIDYIDSLRRQRLQATAPDWLETIADANEQLADDLADEEERRVAQAETELRVGPKKWQVFWLRVYENKSGEEVASQLGLTLGTVYNYFGEVSRTLTKEMEKLRDRSE